jgi:hypothetical protein
LIRATDHEPESILRKLPDAIMAYIAALVRQ